MIITTKESIRDGLPAGDEVLATAIVDRLLHPAPVFNIKGRSYRLRHLEAALRVRSFRKIETARGPEPRAPTPGGLRPPPAPLMVCDTS